ADQAAESLAEPEDRLGKIVVVEWLVSLRLRSFSARLHDGIGRHGERQSRQDQHLEILSWKVHAFPEGRGAEQYGSVAPLELGAQPLPSLPHTLREQPHAHRSQRLLQMLSHAA